MREHIKGGNIICDFFSWIQKGGKLYYLTDDIIEATWPNDEIRDRIGHSAIEEFYPEAKGGTHLESALKVPLVIANEINKGHMAKMAKAGGWNGAHYNKRGLLDSPYWVKVEKFIKDIKKIKWFDNNGEIDPTWKIFDTRDAAWEVAVGAARDAAWEAAGGAARDAARDAALLVRCLVAGFDDSHIHMIHVKKRMEVWKRGYGLLCDINGILYVYKKI